MRTTSVCTTTTHDPFYSRQYRVGVLVEDHAEELPDNECLFIVCATSGGYETHPIAVANSFDEAEAVFNRRTGFADYSLMVVRVAKDNQMRQAETRT